MSFEFKKTEVENKEELSSYHLIRTFADGVYIAIVESYDDVNKSAILKNARRLWKWVGAAELTEIAENGVKNPDDCKFPPQVKNIKLKTTRIECILEVTKKSEKSLLSVKDWTYHE